jgi:glycosyltransferase involved in cell wall biosynthesis
MSRCDVIIPTYNSSTVLPLSLPALLSQAIPNGWQLHLIISDDGSSDHTPALARKIITNNSSQLSGFKILTNRHGGSAAARNHALSCAQGDVIFFLGADIIMRPRVLLQHLNHHTRFPAHNIAVLGMVVWDPRLRPSPFMEWLVHGGPQNDFDSTLGHEQVDPRSYFFGSHLSIKRSFIHTARFDERFKEYGWEDLEFGHRLARKGLKLYVLPQAICHHYHHNDLNQVLNRQQIVGYNLYLWDKREPDLHLLPLYPFKKQIKHMLFAYSGASLLLKKLVKVTHTRFSTPKLFEILIAAAFWKGIKKAKLSEDI